MPFRSRCRRYILFAPFLLTLLLLAAACALPGQSQTKARAKPRAASPVKPPPEIPEVVWNDRVEPLLDKYCLKCHAGVRQRGGLDLRSMETILRGGDSGPEMLPGKPNESRMVQVVLPGAPVHMPLDTKKQLTPAEIAILKDWIALLPAPKSKSASGTAKNNAWVPDYLAEYKRSQQSHEIPPANLPASATIDWFLKTDWNWDKIVPAQLCDDSTFARRAYLDIAGRIPSRDELKSFLADSRPDRRQSLVERLLASDDYPRHFRELFDVVLMGRANNKTARERSENGWNTYLQDSFRTNRPWNEMVRDMILARSTTGSNRGAVWFLAERKNSYQAMAEAVAPIVYGVQIKCAQCHNHPLAWEIEQRHYWGLVAAFNRSKNVETASGPGVAESATGGFINFANLKKESQPAALVFLNGKSVPERIPPPDEKEMDSPELYVVPPAKDGQRPASAAVPRFSRREAFADAATRDNPQLARAFVNRIWGNLLGRGIVQPVDEIDSRHHASHPELLEWLSRDFEKSGYDVKRLVQNIVLSRAYELDCKPSGKTPPLPASFARSVEKPLTAEQLVRSLWIATGSRPEGQSSAEQERAFATTFPDVMPATYNPSLQQALFLSNSPILEDLIKPAPGNTTSTLVALGSNDARVREAFQTVLGRSPDAEEVKQCQSLLIGQPPEKGVRNLLWALLTCAEFQVNH